MLALRYIENTCCNVCNVYQIYENCHGLSLLPKMRPENVAESHQIVSRGG